MSNRKIKALLRTVGLEPVGLREFHTFTQSQLSATSFDVGAGAGPGRVGGSGVQRTGRKWRERIVLGSRLFSLHVASFYQSVFVDGVGLPYPVDLYRNIRMSYLVSNWILTSSKSNRAYKR